MEAGNKRQAIEVLVCDGDAIMVRLLAADLRRHNCFEVDECLAKASELVKAIAERRPSVLVLSARARDPLSETLVLLRQVHRSFPGTRPVVLFDDTDREVVLEVFRAGARGVFDRANYDVLLLGRCIECVADGQVWVRSDQLTCVLDAFSEEHALRASRGIEFLTRRERDVVRLVSEGLCNSDVAQQLGLSIHTVKNYLFRVFDKTGVSTRAELILYLLANRSMGQTTATTSDLLSHETHGCDAHLLASHGDHIAS